MKKFIKKLTSLKNKYKKNKKFMNNGKIKDFQIMTENSMIIS